MDEEFLEADVLARGREVRRQVLGDRHVDASHATATDELMRPKLQLSEYVWSKVWARPGLSLKSRSIANLAMLSALNRPHELKLHVNAALNNGLSKEEICEVLLQTGAYCGLPVAVDSFQIAQQVFKERDG